MTKPVDRDKLVEEIGTRLEDWREALRRTEDQTPEQRATRLVIGGIVSGIMISMEVLETHDGE